MRTLTAWGLLILCFAFSSVATEKAIAQQSSSTAGDQLAAEMRVEDDPNRLLARGLEIYREQLCGVCHRFAKAETGGIFGPAHDRFAAIAAQRIQDKTYTGAARTAAEYIHESIVDPAAYLVPGYESGFHQMPPYIDLTSEDLEALIRLLLLEE